MSINPVIKFHGNEGFWHNICWGLCRSLNQQDLYVMMYYTFYLHPDFLWNPFYNFLCKKCSPCFWMDFYIQLYSDITHWISAQLASSTFPSYYAEASATWELFNDWDGSYMASYYRKHHSMHLFSCHTDQCSAVPLCWFHAHLSVNIFRTTFEPLEIQEFLWYF